MERGYDSTLRRSAPTTRGHVELTTDSQAAEYVSFGLPVMSARTYPVGGRAADNETGASLAGRVEDPIDDWAQVVDLRDTSPTTNQLPSPGWYTYPDDEAPIRWWNGSEWSSDAAGSSADQAVAPRAVGLALATTASVAVRDPLASTTVDAGWYVDPSNQDRHRWWDGEAWTDQLHAGAAADTTSVVGHDAQASVPSTVQGLETGWYTDPLDSSGLRWWDGHGWTEETVAPVGVTEGILESLPAGWYTDPRDESGLRWWDGSAWTDQTHARGGPTTAELEEPAAVLVVPAALAAAAAAWYVDPSDPGTLRWWDGTSWTDHTSSAADADLATEQETGTDAPEVEPTPGVEVVPVAAAAAAAVVGSDAGWYADPLAAALRWWDGTGWTNDTHLLTSTAPLSIAPLALAGGAALGMAGVGLLVASTIPGEVVEPAPAPPPQIARRPVYLRWWFWLLVLGSAALWFLAWQDSQSADVPSVPGITVVPAPSPTSVLPGPSPAEGLLPSLRPEPLGG